MFFVQEGNDVGPWCVYVVNLLLAGKQLLFVFHHQLCKVVIELAPAWNALPAESEA